MIIITKLKDLLHLFKKNNTMDALKIIYAILKVLRDALENGLDTEALSGDMLGISEKRRDNLMTMLQEEGYIRGLEYLVEKRT